jgi:hypothetical protein
MRLQQQFETGFGSAAALVVEFETWSGSGDDVPREWLLARGH